MQNDSLLDFLKSQGFSDTILDRFWRKVKQPKDPTSGCWTWGKTLRSWHQVISRGSKKQGCEGAHRLSWMIHFGPIPEGMFICHICDNPPCVRPDHLFIGDSFTNSRDRMMKGRNGHMPATSKHFKLTIKKVNQIRLRHKAGESQEALAVSFGVSQSNISYIVNDKTWRL